MSEVHNPILGYADSYRQMARVAKTEGRHQMIDMFSVVTDLERNIAPLFASAQSELAALREELAAQKETVALFESEFSKQSVSLTAAEQRIADLCGLLVRTLPVVRMVGRQEHLCDYALAGNIQAEIETTLNPKPTESGAYQSREIGESGWTDCNKSEYDRCGKDPHMDTRIKPTESGASDEHVSRDYPHGESFYRNKDAD